MKAFNIFFIMVFIASAALQYNDPDPVLWMSLYMMGAFICYRSMRKKYNPFVFLAALLIYIPYAFYLFFNQDGVLSWYQEHDAENIAQSMQATKPWIEETREFFGLLLLISTTIINKIWLKKPVRYN